MKRFLWVLGTLVVVLLVAVAGLRWYLTSRYVADKVVTQLQNVYGGKVTVGGADVWLGSSSVRQIALMEDCPGQDIPWLSIDEIDTDLSLFDLLKGRYTPGDVSLKGAKIVLRFDAKGRLITCLPGKLRDSNGDTDLAFIESFPQVRLTNSSIILRKEGAPDFVAEDIDLALKREPGRLALSGFLLSPKWGKWRLDGVISRDRPATFTFKSEVAVEVTRAMLQQIPFVPRSTWDEVDIRRGKTSGSVTITYDFKRGKIGYRVEAAPTNTDLKVTAIDLDATGASGAVAIDNGVVTLVNVTGHAFGGTLAMDAALDFAHDPTRLDFKRIEARGLDVDRFPPSWKFPRQISGKLVGTASLQVVLTDTSTGTKAHTSGSGTAKIMDARVAGQPASEPITLSLKPAAGAFRFASEEEAKAALEQPWLTALLATSLMPPGRLLSETALAAQEKDKAKDDSGLDVHVKESYLNISLKMKDIDLGKFARDLDFKLPFALDGKVSFQVKVAIPVDESKDLKKYKLDGWAKLTNLVVGALRVDDLEGDIAYRDGVLTMPKLTGRLPPDFPGAPAGTFTGSGVFQVEPLGDLKVEVALQRVPVSQIASASGAGTDIKGDLSGSLAAVIPGKELANPSAWQVKAALTSERLEAFRVALKDAAARAELSKGKLVVSSLTAHLYDGQASGAAVIPLSSETPGHVNVRLKGVDAAALARDIPKMPVRIQGRINGELKGTLPAAAPGKERTFNVQLDVTAPKLRVQNIPTEQLKGSVDYKNGLLDYRLEGKTLGGTFELEGRIPPEKVEPKESRKGRLEIHNIGLGRLLEALGVQDAAAVYHGRLSLAIAFTHADSGWPTGSGRLRVTNVRYKETPLIGEAAGDIGLNEGKLRVSDFNTTFGDGLLRAKGAYDFKNPDAGWYVVELDRVQIGPLLGPWLNSTVEGDMNARIRGKFGREISGRAEVDIGRAKVAGVEVTDWRLPFTFRYAPTEGHGQLQMNDITAQVGAGRIKGKLDLSWEYAIRLEGNLQFTRVDLQKLLRPFLGATSVVSGRLTGRFDFAGRDVRSLSDLSGRLDAAFEQTQALNLPVLKEISPFLRLNPSVTFQKGDLHARLADGFFRVQRLGLEGAVGQLYAEGTISLEGRLNLDVTAGTGSFGIDPRLRFLGLRIPAAGPVPLVVAQEAATLLSNRVLQMRVTGTVRTPSIRVLPLATLTQEAVRFFLRSTVGDVPFNP
ncbi:MAG: AsmA-like C-terminal region-containing protein [Gemmataceae bacterium]